MIKDNKQIQVAICLFNLAFLVKSNPIMSMYYLAFYGYQGFANLYLLLSQIIERMNLMRTLY